MSSIGNIIFPMTDASWLVILERPPNLISESLSDAAQK